MESFLFPSHQLEVGTLGLGFLFLSMPKRRNPKLSRRKDYLLKILSHTPRKTFVDTDKKKGVIEEDAKRSESKNPKGYLQLWFNPMHPHPTVDRYTRGIGSFKNSNEIKLTQMFCFRS